MTQVTEAAWPLDSLICAATTTREGGCSKKAYESMNLADHVLDDTAAVAKNRRIFERDRCLPSSPIWLRQTHSVRVAIEQSALPDAADGLITRVQGKVCVVLTADCLPAVFAASDATEIAVAHAGWKGLSGGILQQTLERMQTSNEDISVWLGPAISQPAFEVGAEVREAFVSRSAELQQHFLRNERGRYQADLYGLARQILVSAGVRNVYGGDLCTYADKARFFSYRRDGQCGRMATYAYIR